MITMWLGPELGATVAMLYAIPCIVAGWAFGAVGGLAAAALTAPIHGTLLAAGYLPPSTPGLTAIVGFLSAAAVGTSVGVARDLHERLREKSRRLAESEDRYRELIDNSPEGVLVHERGVIVFANPSMARLAGVPDSARLVGRTLVALAPFEDREALAAEFVTSVQSRGPRAVQARLSREGSDLAVVMTTMPIEYRGAQASLVIVRELALSRPPTMLTVAQ